MLKPCRECHTDVSTEAYACPKCGCPSPTTINAQPNNLFFVTKGVGFEYKSKTTILGLPLVHISFKFGPNRMPVPAKGIISIGQFGIGIINISQFGIGVFSLSQFTIAGYAIAQIGIAYSLLAQIGIYIHHGTGMLVISLTDLFQKVLGLFS